ncbi:MAG: SpoIIE family protein phosphatase, partial [Opitutales bacterium]|nr:SpoIIE family protein phosphatase [Opitutales bacterium]
LIERGESEIEFLDSKGLAIGISKPEVFDATITEISRSYSRGDVLVFYTDGLTEALNPAGEEFGSARLGSVLEKSHDLPADKINEAVLRELNAFTGGNEPADDLTLVTIRAI